MSTQRQSPESYFGLQQEDEQKYYGLLAFLGFLALIAFLAIVVKERK